ncbi:MAG: thioredoxin family protein [Deltaproteobacteria bacterium]|nr:thioredoxin family protein [Deltaproteobacteria bacterium]
MEIIRDEAELQAILQREPGALIVFGEPTCGVDNAVTPRLEALVAARFPKLFMGYVDCQSAGDLCAQEGVYALPVVPGVLRGAALRGAGAAARARRAGGGDRAAVRAHVRRVRALTALPAGAMVGLTGGHARGVAPDPCPCAGEWVRGALGGSLGAAGAAADQRPPRRPLAQLGGAPAWAEEQGAWCADGRWYAVGIVIEVPQPYLAKSAALARARREYLRATRNGVVSTEDRSRQTAITVARDQGPARTVTYETNSQEVSEARSGSFHDRILDRWSDGNGTWAVLIEAREEE